MIKLANVDEDFVKKMVLHIEGWFETSAFSNHLQQFIQVYFSSPQNKGKSVKIKAFTVKNLITGTPVVDWRNKLNNLLQNRTGA